MARGSPAAESRQLWSPALPAASDRRRRHHHGTAPGAGDPRRRVGGRTGRRFRALGSPKAMRTGKDLKMSDLVAPEAEKPAEAAPLPTEAVPERFTVAAVQAAPVFLDRAATVEKACRLIAEAGAAGAKLVVFPETFIPTYPLWVWSIPAGDTRALRELYAELLAAAVTVPRPDVYRIGAAAREAGTTVAIGVNERAAEGSGSTLYDTIVYLGADGRLLGKHRKLGPTTGGRGAV